MVRNIDEDEKVKQITPIYNVYNGQYETQECLFLTEDGLYEVLMQSRKPIAKQLFGGIKMNNLIVQNVNGKLYVDSREVAEMVGKRHDHLIRDIKKYCEILSQNEMSPELGRANFFVPASYKDANNQDRPCYLLTRKGCDMVANKMTGDKGD